MEKMMGKHSEAMWEKMDTKCYTKLGKWLAVGRIYANTGFQRLALRSKCTSIVLYESLSISIHCVASLDRRNTGDMQQFYLLLFFCNSGASLLQSTHI